MQQINLTRNDDFEPRSLANGDEAYISSGFVTLQYSAVHCKGFLAKTHVKTVLYTCDSRDCGLTALKISDKSV